MDQRPEPPPEGKLIADAASHLDLSIREAARRAGISYGRWRQITAGYQNVSPGVYAPVHAPARTVAKMAAVVGISPEQMETAGQRPDAAEVMRDEQERQPHPAAAEFPVRELDDADPPLTPVLRAQALAHLPAIEALMAKATDLAAAEDPDHPVPRGAHLVAAGAAPNEGPRWDGLTEAAARLNWSPRKILLFMAIGRTRDDERRAQGQGSAESPGRAAG